MGGRLYWTDHATDSTGVIRRSMLDGGEVKNVLTTEGFFGGIAIDAPAGKIYYGGPTSRGEGGILRVGLDGSGVEDVVFVQDADGIALDIPHGRIFQLDRCDSFIFLHHLDQGSTDTLVEAAEAMAIDLAREELYWFGVLGGRVGIHRLRLDGTAVATVLPVEDWVSGLALDLDAGKLYWSDRMGGRIVRANLDGTAREDVVTGLGAPFGLVLSIGGPPLLRYIRGDANADGAVNITDAVYLATFLLAGGAPIPCGKSADTDDGGSIELTDAVFLLNSLFLGGRGVAEPASSCGVDPSADVLTCTSFPPCR
jgi:hypothetical protein